MGKCRVCQKEIKDRLRTVCPLHESDDSGLGAQLLGAGSDFATPFPEYTPPTTTDISEYGVSTPVSDFGDFSGGGGDFGGGGASGDF